jgi:hypothetical protein
VGYKHKISIKDIQYTHVVCLLLALLGTTTEAKNQVKSGLLLDVVVAKSTTILELLSSKDQALLVGGNAKAVMRIDNTYVR